MWSETEGGGVSLSRVFLSLQNKCEVTSRLQTSDARVEGRRCCAHCHPAAAALRAKQQLAVLTEASCSQTNFALIIAAWPSLSPTEFYRDPLLAAPLTAVNHWRLLNKCLFVWIILSSTLKITSFGGSTILECPTDSKRLHKQASVLSDGEEMWQQSFFCDKYTGCFSFQCRNWSKNSEECTFQAFFYTQQLLVFQVPCSNLPKCSLICKAVRIIHLNAILLGIWFLKSSFQLYLWEIGVDVTLTVNLCYFFYCFIELKEENNTFLCHFLI